MASKITCVILVLFVVLAISEASKVTVDGWTVENSLRLTKWTLRHHFTVGDIIQWNTRKGFEAPVMQVTKEAFESCDVSDPIKDNVTEVTLDAAGSYYFVSGVKEICYKGLKMAVVAHSPRNNNNNNNNAPVSAPSLAPHSNNLAAAPTSAAELTGGWIVAASIAAVWVACLVVLV